ncbi:hypothetical protein KJA15_01095 [Patescibacteria group bacterium]|nr:hypothetical protein [Patescibacteria group bacterium]
MKLKQFLKSDRRKIIVFIILFLISAFVPYIPCERHWLKHRFYPELFPSPKWTFCSAFPIGPTEVRYDYLGIENPELSKFIILFFLFIFPYLLSCVIIWIYDKFRKKP